MPTLREPVPTEQGGWCPLQPNSFWGKWEYNVWMCQLVNTEGATNGQGGTRSPGPQESLLPEIDGLRQQLGEAQPMK